MEYYHEKAESIMNFMHREKIEESPLNVRKRAQRIKEKLKEYRKQYSKIAIVSHFYTIRYLCCREFDEKDEPVNGILMHNCGLYSTSLDEINKFS